MMPIGSGIMVRYHRHPIAMADYGTNGGAKLIRPAPTCPKRWRFGIRNDV